ncbi:cyclic AMP-dependent transcription factor ATF-4 [Falco biarmicus]|uniref:cyclic AMP-dependent transcription factor ATF-4 n=1 Tax=Falco cherrug TaxID=345164 RepID=UPI000392DBD0|nr:cyclic AMP-dependent transcription factor ATF-4 [Falco cherrug]XP_037245367.1 cyclic AMP-dependent transcription factor ATF-4 [Falco rusticolus]XP_037245368.1 cyclic AMP-dependent transcription factor ATF-4 [Falco rusticolus]XP_056195464.1 cyclic AMP-dependent transcription factor ATF-4 [Falco biarmicus]
MSLLNNEMLLGDSLSPFSQPCSVAEESLGLLDDYLEVAEPLGSHGFSSDKAKAVSSNWLAVDSLGNTIDSSQEDAFSGMEWMVEKMDLKEFDFDALLGMEHLEATVSPDELMATLEDTCDLLFNPTIQEFHSKEPSLITDLIAHLPESPIGADPMAPLASLWSFPLSPGSLTSTPDHSFSLELGSEVDVLEGERKQEAPTFVVVITKSEKEEENHSDDSGICMSPDSYLGTPQHSPTNSVGSPNDNQFPADASCGSVRSKPYDHPAEKVVPAKIKGEKKIDKKLKKMEQNKTAATRYRQKKRAEQEALSGECRELEQKNQALKEKADSLSKEIQYLKDLIEEVRKAKGKRARVPE